MKKIGICLMVILSFVLVGSLAYDFRMSSRYSVVQFQPSDMTAAEIKEEFPAIAFSEKDHALHADVMALPEVQAALAAEEETIFASEEGAALLAGIFDRRDAFGGIFRFRWGPCAFSGRRP